MATAKDILAAKSSEVVTIGPEATVLEAATLMTQHKVGALVITEGGNVCGMFSERDVLQRVVVQRKDPTTTLVRDVMTVELICCRRNTSIEEARVVMKEKRIRHLPVLDDGEKLCGMISIGDLNAHEAHSQEMTIHLLHAYISGHAAVPGAP